MSLALVLLRFLKYGFGLSVMGGTAYFIKMSVDLEYIENANEYTWDDMHQPWRNRSALSTLDSDHLQCLKIPSKEFCLMTSDKKLIFLNNRKLRKKKDSNSEAKSQSEHKELQRRHPVDAAITEFTQVAKFLDINVVLIEPSILFCMLTSEQKILLQKRGLRLPMGLRNTISFAAFSSNATKLDSISAKMSFQTRGFHHYSTKDSRLPWRKDRSGHYVGHHFFLRRLIVVHVVIFQERGDFLWHSRLSAQDIPEEVMAVISESDDLLFTTHHSAYERFSSREITTNDVRSPAIHIPENPALFLLQMRSSQFLECPLASGEIGEKAMERPFQIIVQALKYILEPFLLEFSLFSDTLLAWYNECDLNFNKTFHFAVWTEGDIDYLRFDDKFENASYLVKQITGHSEKNLKITLTNLFSSVQLSVLNNKANNRKKKGYQSQYRKYELCSSEVQNQRILVPCEPQKFLEEYSRESNSISPNEDANQQI